jgi:hypothetical protein
MTPSVKMKRESIKNYFIDRINAEMLRVEKEVAELDTSGKK